MAVDQTNCYDTESSEAAGPVGPGDQQSRVGRASLHITYT